MCRLHAVRTRENQNCCNAAQVHFSAPQTRRRGPPRRARWKTSRQVIHYTSTTHWWHWEDQTQRVVVPILPTINSEGGT